MLLRLEAIKFNHDTSSATVDAFNIRKNETEFIEPPEWRRGLSINPEDSPAAYALCETRGNTLTIKASFCTDTPGSIEVCAIDGRIYPALEGGPDLPPNVLALLHPPLGDGTANILGSVLTKTITLSEGESSFLFDLQNVRIWDVGVGLQDIIWRWRYRLGGTSIWTEFAVTTHRIYTTLTIPTCPWQEGNFQTSNIQLPWADVLYYACDWAAGTQNSDDAAEAITRRVNQLGPSILHYANSTFYTDQRRFDCTSFVRRLRVPPGTKGGAVNCDDCATIVSTFANAVGCSLSQMCIRRIGKDHFRLNRNLRIGKPQWQKGSFYHHEVASEGQCREEDEVFDACLQVDTSEGLPHPPIALLPTNLRFGHTGEAGYRFRLVAQQDEPYTQPHPQCKRRQIGPINHLDDSCVDRALFEELFHFDSWKNLETAGERLFVSKFFFTDYMVPALQLVEVQYTNRQAPQPVIQSFWTSVPDLEDIFFRVDVYETASWQQAREGAMRLLTTFHEPSVIRRDNRALGDVAFADRAFETILFATGNLVFLLRNVGGESLSLSESAASINSNILNPPPGTIEPITPVDRVTRFHFETAESFVNDKVKIIGEEPTEPLLPERLYQFFSPTGEVSRQDDDLVYHAQSAGLNTLRIFAADRQGNALQQVLELKVR
jgi:hypothetical protein